MQLALAGTKFALGECMDAWQHLQAPHLHYLWRCAWTTQPKALTLWIHGKRTKHYVVWKQPTLRLRSWLVPHALVPPLGKHQMGGLLQGWG